MPDPDIRIRKLVKRFGDVVAVDGIDLDVPRGAFVTFLGPSGCGKTTTLRMIGGFEHPDSGEILLNGDVMGTRPPHQRDTAMVFQNYALFPHMTVSGNIGFGLRERKVPKADIARRVDRMLELVKLENHGDRMPRELSGGQQQRVALARSLVIEPTVLLLDEPLGALDLMLRRQMQHELKRIQQEVGITFIYVTHDQDEALTMSDRIVVMNRGRIEQEGTPEDIFERPRTRFVACFMGSPNVLGVDVVDRDVASTRLRLGSREITLPVSVTAGVGSGAISIRPGNVRLDVLDGWRGRVVDRVYQGATMSYRVRCEDSTELTAEIAHGASVVHAVGDEVRPGFRPEDAVFIPDEPRTSGS